VTLFRIYLKAQAQECYVEKSLKYSTGLKFVTIAKLTAKVSVEFLVILLW